MECTKKNVFLYSTLLVNGLFAADTYRDSPHGYGIFFEWEHKICHHMFPNIAMEWFYQIQESVNNRKKHKNQPIMLVS